jgi:hypothetical protein
MKGIDEAFEDQIINLLTVTNLTNDCRILQLIGVLAKPEKLAPFYKLY